MFYGNSGRKSGVTMLIKGFYCSVMAAVAGPDVMLPTLLSRFYFKLELL